MKKPFLSLGIALVLVGGGVSALAQEAVPPSRPAAPRAREAELRAELRELKALGRHEEARELLNKLNETRPPGKRVPLARQPEPEGQAVPMAPAAWEIQLRRVVEHLERVINERHHDQAVRLKALMTRIEERLEQGPPPARPQPGIQRARPDLPERPGRGPHPPEAAPRQRHFMAAIENLHAAGLHELAERLTRQREELLRPRPEAEGPAVPGEEIRRLRAELDEVRQALRRLSEHVEELHRDRR